MIFGHSICKCKLALKSLWLCNQLTAVCLSQNRALQFWLWPRYLTPPLLSPHLFPPAARCPALPAASPSLVLLVGWRRCSNLLVYNPLLHASGTFNSLDGKWYLCMNVSAFKICNFFFFRLQQVLFVLQAVHWRVLIGTVNDFCLPSTFFF